MFDENFKKIFVNSYKFCNHDITEFILSLGKSIYPYWDWEKLNETSLPEKRRFLKSPKHGDTTDVDYMHKKRVCKYLEIKNLGEYNDLYVYNDTLLLADACDSFENMCLETHELEPVCFLTPPGIAWQVTLKIFFKKSKVNLNLLTDFDMVLITEKRISGETCHAIHQYTKANNKYMKYYDKYKESPDINIGTKIICMDGPLSRFKRHFKLAKIL